jgi:retron-type reverse transcriptase
MNNYRGIALQDIVEKIFAIILLKRIEPIVEPQIYEGQYGFRRNKSTVDAIHSIRKIVESSKEYKKNLYISFVDITKAYD